MSKAPKKSKATSPEITGGAGFTYEDTVVAYYLSALLREEGAALQMGVVKSVAVQQSGHDRPMDDMIVEFESQEGLVNLDLQIKTSLSISSGNADFQDVIRRALETRAQGNFQPGLDVYGFAAEQIAVAGLRSMKRLIEWAKASPDAGHFERRFQEGGSAATAERDMRDDLRPLISAHNLDEEWSFYRHFVGGRFDGLNEGGIFRTEITNRLQELVASNEDGQGELLFDRLCRIVRDGAGTARKWTRASLINQLRGSVRLAVSPNYRADIDIIQRFSADGITEIIDDIEGFRVNRPELRDKITETLKTHRVVNISGLPGCGKSVVLRRVASEAHKSGPIIFLRSDRLPGKSWLEFAATLGLQHRNADELLTEIAASGSSVLYIDGIDRINPDQKHIILDILYAIESNPALHGWQVLASSRDQGLETFRAWFPPSFYKGSTIGDVQVKPFNEDEAEALAKEKPGLRRLLMGTSAVQDIARRPFFAAVLARSFRNEAAEPKTETDLINAWWARAGHDAPASTAPQRQRALLDLAERGIGNLGKNIPARNLAPATFEHITALKDDLIILGQDGDAYFSFTHDIFFEWVFFRHLIDLGSNWKVGIARAGEPPLLGRVVGLLAQHCLTLQGNWSAGYTALEESSLRPQWRREWLTAPPFTSAFTNAQKEFTDFVSLNDFAVLEKVLVWFQAEHTIPSPMVLGQTETEHDGFDRIRLAEIYSWPSDFDSWGRFLDWLMPLAPNVPIRLLPNIVEVFSVWQNALSDLQNPRSKAIVECCNQWLIELEEAVYQDRVTVKRSKWDALGRDALKQFATSLRIVILRAARAYPTHTNALFDRAIANRTMREAAYSDLMALSWMMVEVSPEKFAAVAKAELCEELPQEKADRIAKQEAERIEELRRIRAKPESERTKNEKMALQNYHPPISSYNEYEDDIGIDRHHRYYFPVSALHEPFASLFAKKPDVAFELIRHLANRATTGWRQSRQLSRRYRCTPIPITITLPWGTQQFWGSWPEYNWHLGQLGPQPLECALLAMSYWAFREIEGGRSVDEVIRLVVEGNESIAAAGLGLLLAIEKIHVSEVTLAIVSCQRLWGYDINRIQQEPIRNIDLLGFGALSRLTGERANAKAYLDSRVSRSRDVKQLAMRFAINPDDTLRARFQKAIESFPSDLPYEFEEQRSDQDATAMLTELATEYAAIAAPENYQTYQTPDEQILVAYQPPVSPEAAEQGERARNYLEQTSYLVWAMKSLRDSELAPDKTLAEAVALARPLHTPSLFNERHDVQDHTPQSLVAAVAACVVCYGDFASDDYAWALDLLTQIDNIREPAESYSGSQDPWHPAIQLIYALSHLRKVNPQNLSPAHRLLQLTMHPHEGISEFAFAALLADPTLQVSWTVAQLALDLAQYHQPDFTTHGERDNTASIEAMRKAQEKAERGLIAPKPDPFPPLPPAWISQKIGDNTQEVWREPDPRFDPGHAQNMLRSFPIESWCASPTFKPLTFELLWALVKWTADRLNPPGDDLRRDRTSDLLEWNDALGDLLARVAPFFDTDSVTKEFLSPFLNNAKALGIIANFATMTVTRHVLDAPEIPKGTLDLLVVCVDRVISDPTFSLDGYRAGEISDRELSQLIDALLMITVKQANGSTRFANGNWSDVGIVMPLVTPLISATGWSADVMGKFLLLCERAGTAYPIDDFIEQAIAALAKIENAKGSWMGTSLAARTAGIVQRLADANFPLRTDQAQGLLRILDALIELGDRRSAALEQSEVFKNIQFSDADRT